jgi:hypothetical protein
MVGKVVSVSSSMKSLVCPVRSIWIAKCRRVRQFIVTIKKNAGQKTPDHWRVPAPLACAIYWMFLGVSVSSAKHSQVGADLIRCVLQICGVGLSGEFRDPVFSTY